MCGSVHVNIDEQSINWKIELIMQLFNDYQSDDPIRSYDLL